MQADQVRSVRLHAAEIAAMRGATLIELMLALLISTLIFSSLITVYLATQTVNQAQVALTTIQQNGRVATSLLSLDIKMAGYTGCAKLRKNYPINYSADFSLTNENKIQPYHSTAIKVGSAALTVRHVAGENAVLIKPMKNDSLLYASAKPRFFKGDLLHLSDCSNAELFIVKELIRENNGIQKILPERPLHALYGENSGINRFNINTYFIGQTTRRNARGTAIYALYRQDIKLHKTELIEGVEDMKVKYNFLDNGRLYEIAEGEVNDWSRIAGVSIILTLTDLNSVLLKKNEYIYVSLHSI